MIWMTQLWGAIQLEGIQVDWASKEAPRLWDRARYRLHWQAKIQHHLAIPPKLEQERRARAKEGTY